MDNLDILKVGDSEPEPIGLDCFILGGDTIVIIQVIFSLICFFGAVGAIVYTIGN